MLGGSSAHFVNAKSRTMEIPGIEDFNRLERKIDRCMVMLSILTEKDRYTVPTQKILTVKDVASEFKLSPHIQRCARAAGTLKWIAGSKEVKYNRADVEDWLEKNIVR